MVNTRSKSGVKPSAKPTVAANPATSKPPGRKRGPQPKRQKTVRFAPPSPARLPSPPAIDHYQMHRYSPYQMQGIQQPFGYGMMQPMPNYSYAMPNYGYSMPPLFGQPFIPPQQHYGYGLADGNRDASISESKVYPVVPAKRARSKSSMCRAVLTFFLFHFQHSIVFSIVFLSIFIVFFSFFRFSQ